LFILAPASANAGPNAAICENTAFTLSSASAQRYSSLQWTTSGSGSFNNSGILKPVYTPSAADIQNGFVQLTLIAQSISPCIGEATHSMVLTIRKLAVADAGDDQIILRESVHTAECFGSKLLRPILVLIRFRHIQ
jgi:hypothetical protein